MADNDIGLPDTSWSFLTGDTLKSLKLNSELSDTMKNVFNTYKMPSIPDTGMAETLKKLADLKTPSMFEGLADMRIPSILDGLANITIPSSLTSLLNHAKQANGVISSYAKSAEAIAGMDTLKNFRHEVPEMPAIEHFHIPRNPQYETNEKLDVLLEQNETTNILLKDYIGQSTGLMTSLNDTMIKLAIDSAQSAAQSRKQNTFMIRISMISLIITAIAFSVNYWQSSHLPKNTEATKAIINNQIGTSKEMGNSVKNHVPNKMPESSLKYKYGVYDGI